MPATPTPTIFSPCFTIKQHSIYFTHSYIYLGIVTKYLLLKSSVYFFVYIFVYIGIEHLGAIGGVLCSFPGSSTPGASHQ